MSNRAGTASMYINSNKINFLITTFVTVETNGQFEAIRGYLKELDITENVWIGLKRNSEASEFTWT